MLGLNETDHNEDGSGITLKIRKNQVFLREYYSDKLKNFVKILNTTIMKVSLTLRRKYKMNTVKKEKQLWEIWIV